MPSPEAIAVALKLARVFFDGPPKQRTSEALLAATAAPVIDEALAGVWDAAETVAVEVGTSAFKERQKITGPAPNQRRRGDLIVIQDTTDQVAKAIRAAKARALSTQPASAVSEWRIPRDTKSIEAAAGKVCG